jgi:hypothetical protein
MSTTQEKYLRVWNIFLRNRDFHTLRMEATMTTGNRQKVELALNESATLKLLKEKCYEGTNSFGPYYLYTVEHQAQEKALFATADVHQHILEAGLKTGDTFSIKKVPVQNGKKLTAKVEFAVVKKTEPQLSNGNGRDDHYRDIMEQCVREAIGITSNVNTVPWQNEDVRSIALTLFIQRARAN